MNAIPVKAPPPSPFGSEMTGRLGRGPRGLAGAAGCAIIYGVAHPDVASVGITLADGDTITVTPQDLSGHFTENFFFVSFPFPNDGTATYVFEAVDTIVARGARGDPVALYRAPDWNSP